MNTFFGLDFGTTNSALSVNENGNVRLIDIDEFNLAEKTKEARKNDILSTGGVSIGGDIFDSDIM